MMSNQGLDPRAPGSRTLSRVSCSPSRDVELINLTKRYGKNSVVTDLDLTINNGEFLALLGPSGSGKTSVLMMIAGFTAPSSGDIRFGGKSVVKVPPEERAIGVVFQNYALFPHLTVFKNIAFPLELRRIDRGRTESSVRHALMLVGLKGYADRYPHELSGGQQQRVALARALVFDPTLLLMDEPLGALDKQLRQQMQLELRSLHRDLGKTLLYVTHDQQEAFALADRIAILKAGRLVQIDSPENLYRHPADEFVASFVGNCNFVAVTEAKKNGNQWEVIIGGYSGLVSAAPNAHQDHQGVRKLAVRPHLAKLGGQEEVRGLDGFVTDVLFMGETIEYVVQHSTDQKFIVSAAARHVGNFEKGDAIKLTWRWEEAFLV